MQNTASHGTMQQDIFFRTFNLPDLFNQGKQLHLHSIATVLKWDTKKKLSFCGRKCPVWQFQLKFTQQKSLFTISNTKENGILSNNNWHKLHNFCKPCLCHFLYEVPFCCLNPKQGGWWNNYFSSVSYFWMLGTGKVNFFLLGFS